MTQRVTKPRLTLFDLDHTLIDGDSDVLWCDFLMDEGLLDRAEFSARNHDMDVRYKAGTVGVEEFANFYVGTLAGRSPGEWEPIRQRFFIERVAPRIYSKAKQCVSQHLAAGELVVMTTATNRFLTELTTEHFGIVHLLATEPEIAHGKFTGRTVGTLNMRGGKVTRLNEWLAARGESLPDYSSRAYSDSINDLALLEAVDEAICANADSKLRLIARERGWQVIDFA